MRVAPLVATALLLIAALAGCLSPAGTQGVGELGTAPPVSLPVFERMLQEEVRFASFDGAELYGVVYRPDVPESVKVPVIIDHSPYFGNAKPSGLEKGNDFSAWLIDYFVPRGYAVVLQNVRSTGPSGGCWDHGGPREQKDSYEIVEHYGTQPWSNGKVALIGKSYDGTTPWEAAIQKPPHLATIVPMSGITHMYGYNYYNGVGYNPQGPLFNTYYPLNMDWDVDAFPPPSANPTPRPVESACPQLAQTVAEGFATHLTGTYDAWWKERDYRPLLPEIEVPVFLIHGMQDWNVKLDHVESAFNDLQVPKMGWFGQWGHHYPTRADWNTTLLAWFDHWLKGYENGIEAQLGMHVEDSLGRWHIESAWPPTRAANLTLYLGPGALALEPPAAGSAAFTSLPTTVPDRASLVPGEALYFSTEPLDAATQVAGVPSVTLHVASTKPAGRVVVTLYDIDETGKWKWITNGYLDLKHRDSLDSVQPVVPGEVMNVTFRLFATDTVFEAGHRIGVGVSSEAFRRIVTDGSNPVTEIVHWGGARASSLTLPVLPDVVYESPQPVMLDLCDSPGNC